MLTITVTRIDESGNITHQTIDRVSSIIDVSNGGFIIPEGPLADEMRERLVPRDLSDHTHDNCEVPRR